MNRFSTHTTPASVRKKLSNDLKSIRKLYGYTQLELAERSGVSLGSLKRFEQTGQISMDSFITLLNIFNRLEAAFQNY